MKLSTALLTFTLSLAASALAFAMEGAKGGNVAEAVQGGGYTYLKLEDEDTWIATGAMEVFVGDRIEYNGGMEMRDFHSKALDRTFESIWFVERVAVADRDLDRLHHGVEQGHGASPPPIPKPAAVAAPTAGEIERLADGLTIADIHADPAALADRQVGLRARVIKVNENIMGKNWVTLQDGTGEHPADKLLATSAQTATPGETVTVAGVLRTDVDLGSGYRYQVILEDASFTR